MSEIFEFFLNKILGLIIKIILAPIVAIFAIFYSFFISLFQKGSFFEKFRDNFMIIMVEYFLDAMFFDLGMWIVKIIAIPILVPFFTVISLIVSIFKQGDYLKNFKLIFKSLVNWLWKTG